LEETSVRHIRGVNASHSPEVKEQLNKDFVKMARPFFCPKLLLSKQLTSAAIRRGI
jgi:hypothetical protein